MRLWPPCSMFLLLFWLFRPEGAIAQPAPASPISGFDSLWADTSRLTFLSLEKNEIGRPETLTRFFKKLFLLEQGLRPQVRIVHIGDSHIQADFFPGKLRSLLQHRFGSAGRGLVFPFTLAHTHCPLDLGFRSNTSWESRKSVWVRRGPELGICGISIRSPFPRPTIEVELKERYHYGLDYAFNRITLFYDRAESAMEIVPELTPVVSEPYAAPATERISYRIKSGDTLYDLGKKFGCSVAELKRWNGLSSSRLQVGQSLFIEAPVPAGGPPADISRTLEEAAISRREMSAHMVSYSLPKPTRRLILRGYPDPDRPPEMTFYGMILENTYGQGILYHTIGVNGVTFYHFNRAERFFTQLPDLKPDLVIVSLGTNEALASSFREDPFAEEVDRLINQLKRIVPQSDILITTNPDVLRRKRFDNPNNHLVRQVLLDKAEAQQIALWDLHEIMGGQGSIRHWQERKLGHTDFIHFKKEGYWLQASLLFEALLRAYDTEY